MSDTIQNTTGSTSELVTKNSLTSILKSMLTKLKDDQIKSWMPEWLPFSYQGDKNDTQTVTKDNEVAFGSHNSSSDDTLFSIGCGDATVKKNAFEVKTNGDVYIGGELCENAEPIAIEFIEELN